MQIFTNLKDWWQHVYSIQLILLLIALIYLVNHLYREAEQMNERRFVWLSVIAGLIGFLVIGALQDPRKEILLQHTPRL